VVALPEPVMHTVLAIWQAYESKASGSGDNTGVPMSVAASDCSRSIWYALRWAAPPEVIDGQKQRRFATGHREEDRLLADLEAAGIEVIKTDPATGEQFRAALADGWLRGKLDGKVIGVPEAPKTTHVVEIKSHNDKSFKDLQKKKLKDGKPEHYVQCQLYMKALKLTRCLYLAVNKNDDSLYAERISYEPNFAAQIEEKIKKVVKANSAPPKLFNNPDDRAAFVCRWCRARPQCHDNQFARFNCRTCIEAEFMPNAEVRCALWNRILSYDDQQKGCAKHLFLPSLVPGEQIDSDEKKRTVTYELRNGQKWVDGKLAK